jgi:hypothetical protein
VLVNCQMVFGFSHSSFIINKLRWENPCGDCIIIEGILSMLLWGFGSTASPHGGLSSPILPSGPLTPWSRNYG